MSGVGVVVVLPVGSGVRYDVIVLLQIVDEVPRVHPGVLVLGG